MKNTSNGIAGEYYVAAELTRRGMIATRTDKNTQDIDILAANPNTGKTVLIQVKEKSTKDPAFTVSSNEKTIARQKGIKLWYVCVDLFNSYKCYIANANEIFDNALIAEKEHMSKNNGISTRGKSKGQPKKPSPALYFVPQRDLLDSNGKPKENNWGDLPIFKEVTYMKKCLKCELNYIKNDQELCDVCLPQTHDTKSDTKTFYSMGLNNGDQIEFIFDPKIKATIYGERTVLFENQEWHLTPLMTELCKRTGQKTTYGSGFEVFKYDNSDSTLYVRWYRFNKENQ